MAKGSIRFDDLINVEVAVDPTQAAGAKLLSAVNLVDGQALGGGGDSDFSTASLTIKNETDNTYHFFAAHYDELEESAGEIIAVGQNEITVPIILYKGTALGNFATASGAVITIAGDIVDDEGYYIMTGDCTITLSAPQ